MTSPNDRHYQAMVDGINDALDEYMENFVDGVPVRVVQSALMHVVVQTFNGVKPENRAELLSSFIHHLRACVADEVENAAMSAKGLH